MTKLLEINFEFRKGLLFIRLKGELNKKNSKELASYLDKFIHDKGVKYFVINLENIDYLEKEGLKMIQERYQEMILHDGKLVICGYKNKEIKTMIEEEMKGAYKVKDELKAFQLIKV